MKIFLYNETNFNNNGLGYLTDTLSAKVTEELNGDYYLQFTYALNGALSEYLAQDNIIECKTQNGTRQLFRIKRVISDFNKIEVYAQHIFYDLLNNFLLDTAPTNLTCASFGTWILNKTDFATNFTFTSDITNTASARYVRRNPVEAIMGDIDNSMLNLFGGDIVRNNFTISINQQMGADNGAKLIFGKNITQIKITNDSTNIVTRLLPLGFDGLMLPEKYVDSPNISQYLTPRIAKVEFSNIKYDPTGEDGYSDIEDAYTALRTATQNLYADGIDMAQINIKIDWIELSKTEEYKNYQALESLHLGDYVSCYVLGLNYATRVIKTIYNVLTDTIEKFEIGSMQRSITTSVNLNTKRVEQINTTSILQSAKENATNQINTALGGYIVKTQTDLYIMDTPDTSTAQKVWRWNLNGLGYSSTGINGTYQTAMTADGQIVADFITTGTMSADRITNLREVVLSQNGATILIGEDENNPSIAFVLQDSPYRLVIDNDEIDIYENDKIISRWKTDTFTTTKLYFGTDVTNPSFGFVPRENGSLSFRKVG